MNIPISNSISTHLEFLGFQVEDISKEGPNDILLCKHQSKSNIIVFIMPNENIIFQSTYSGIDGDIQKVLRKINEIHTTVNFTRWYIPDISEKEKNVRIETHLKGYNRQDFGESVENFEKEISTMLPELAEI